MKPPQGETPQSAFRALINPKNVILPENVTLSNSQIQIIALACLARQIRIPDIVVDILPKTSQKLKATLFQYLSQTAREVPTHNFNDVIKRVKFDTKVLDVNGNRANMLAVAFMNDAQLITG